MDSRIRGLRACSGAKIWPLAGAARYIDLGNLRISYHTWYTPRLSTITSATPLIRSIRCHRADLERAARARVVFHGANLFKHDANCDAAFRFFEIDTVRVRSKNRA